MYTKRISDFMRDKEKYAPLMLKVALAVWLVLWCIFFFRENKDGEYGDYFRMFGKSLEGKKKVLLGADFYDYIVFCRNNVPPESRYKFAGLKPFAIEEVRAMYYLAPMKLVEEDNEYIFVYNSGGVSPEGFEKTAEFSKDSFILKRK